MSVVECIHGMEGTQCAICFPKPEPVAPPRAPAARSSRSGASVPRRAPRVAGGASAAARAAAPAKAPVNVGEQRLYHLTHLSNLSQIIAAGSLFSDQNDSRTAEPAVDISSADTRQARRRATVTEPVGVSVACYVPFFLSPNACVWESIRSQSGDSRLSPNTHAASAYDFVLLVTTIADAFDAHAMADPSAGANVIVTDGDAAGTLTLFGTSRESSERMLRSMRADEESDTVLHAEVLVRDVLPFERVTLIGVANDKVRHTVKGILGSSDHKPKVAVYPPWFQSADDAE